MQIHSKSIKSYRGWVYYSLIIKTIEKQKIMKLYLHTKYTLIKHEWRDCIEASG